MAAVCNICGKGPGFGMSVPHPHRRNKRHFNLNIQRVRALVKGTPKYLNVCTKCIKSEHMIRPAAVQLEFRLQ